MVLYTYLVNKPYLWITALAASGAGQRDPGSGVESIGGMIMAPVKSGRFAYDPESIIWLRKQMKLSQAATAKRLGVSVNTLSRWETGKTIPDANSLAALFSLGAQHGTPPSFFRRRPSTAKPPKGRSRLIVVWDFQNVALHPGQVADGDRRIRAELERRFACASERLFKAFASPIQDAASELLNERGWRVFEDEDDIDADLASHAKSDCGQEPADSDLVLIAADGGYAELVEELRDRRVSVHVLSVGQQVSIRLRRAVGDDRCLTVA